MMVDNGDDDDDDDDDDEDPYLYVFYIRFKSPVRDAEGA